MINEKDKRTFAELIYMRDMTIQQRDPEWAKLAESVRDEYHKYANDIEEMLGKMNLEIRIAGEVAAARKLSRENRAAVKAFAKTWILENVKAPKHAAELFPGEELIEQIFKKFGL